MPYALIDGVRLYYEASGRGSSLLFLHGYTGSHDDWASQFRLLSGKYHVVALDHRGHGKSEAPSSASQYSIKIMAEDARSLLRHLGVKAACLVGHSMGGFMALELASKYPEMVTALVLVDTSSGEFERVAGYAELRARLDELAKTEGMNAAFEFNSTHNPMTSQQFERHPERREIVRQKMLQTSVDGYIHIARAISEWQPVTSRLPEIARPTLIVVGEEDAPFHKPSRLLERSIKNSRLVMVPNSGHSPHEESPDFFNRALTGFLNSLRS